MSITFDDRCPRCGGAFHCGAQDARCDCFDLQLTPEMREQLAREFDGCLCLNCLRQLQSAAAAPITTPSPAPRA